MTFFRIQYYAKYQSDDQLGGSFTFILFFFSFGELFLMFDEAFEGVENEVRLKFILQVRFWEVDRGGC